MRPVCRIGSRPFQPPVQFWVAVELGPAVVRARKVGQFAWMNDPQSRRSAANPPMQDGCPLEWNRLILRAVNEADRNLTQEHKIRVGIICSATSRTEGGYGCDGTPGPQAVDRQPQHAAATPADAR